MPLQFRAAADRLTSVSNGLQGAWCDGERDGSLRTGAAGLRLPAPVSRICGRNVTVFREYFKAAAKFSELFVIWNCNTLQKYCFVK